MEQQNDLFTSGIKIDGIAKEQIRSIASWAMVIVVVAVCGYVLNIMELIMQPGEPVITQSEGFSASFISGQKSVIGTIIMIVVGLGINYFLYRFASTAVGSINGLSQEKFGNSFRNLKIYFAISTIIIILVAFILFFAVLVLL